MREVRKNIYLWALLSVTGGLFYGMNFSVLAEVLPCLRANAGFSDSALSFLSASFSGGGTFSLLGGGFVVDGIGRRRTLWLGMLLFLIATLIIVWSPDSLSLVLSGRLIQGVGCGLIGLVLPMYLMETAVASERARRIALFQFSIGAGALCGSCGGGVANSLFESLDSVRLMFALMLLPAIVFGWGLLLAPDSSARDIPAPSCKTRNLGRTFFFVLSVMVLTQAVGPGPIQAYAVDLLNKSGYSVVEANMADTGMRCASLTGAILAVLLVKKIGVRLLLRQALVGLSFALSAIAMVTWLCQVGVLSKGFPLASMLAVGLIAAMGFFNLGPGACAWTIAAEMLSPEVRAKGMSVALLANSGVCALNIMVFLPLTSVVGIAPVFALYGIAAFAYVRLVKM